MKRLATILVPLFLFGCTGPALDAQVKEVQAAAIKACGFLPTASSVAAILSANNPAVVGVSAVAAAICAAATQVSPQARSGVEQACPKVNDVCVEGEFVAKDQTTVPK